MSDKSETLESITTSAIERGLGPSWGRLAPLSVGAVAASVLATGGVALIQRLTGGSGRRLLAFVGGAVLVPLGLVLLLPRPLNEDDESTQEGEENGTEASEARA